MTYISHTGISYRIDHMMISDALALFIARSPAAMISTMQDKQGPAFLKAVFLLSNSIYAFSALRNNTQY